MDREKAILRDAFAKQRADLRSYVHIDFQRVAKGSEASKSMRNEGNALYTQKRHTNRMHQQILHNYCRCILLAPNNSEELALGYGNRSAFLLHINRYNDCIKDVDRALKIKSSNSLKIKLLCRKAECLKLLGSLENESTLKEAQNIIDKLEKDKDIASGLLEKVMNMRISSDSVPEKEPTFHEIKDPFQSVSIHHNEEFGRHLVAAKDFIPGDVILTENFYASFVNKKMSYTNCDYCLKIAWSGVPCKHCSWVLFCSEECQEKAMKSYHDVECSLIPFLMATMEDLYNIIKLSLRAVIIGIREAGSVAQLRNRLKEVDRCTDPCLKGFYKNGKITNNTIESLYSMNIDYIKPDCITEDQTEAVLKALIGIAHQTQLIKNFVFREIEDIMRSNDMLFLGSLMLKFLLVEDFTNQFVVGKHHVCEQGSAIEHCYQNSCCARASYISSLANLVNHSCNPNAGKCFTDHRQVVLYAVQPIKKNEQIFISYCCHFYALPLPQRREALEGYNIHNCFCQACKENWPPMLMMPFEHIEKFLIGDCINIAVQSKYEEKLVKKFSKVFAIVQNNSIVKNKHAYFKRKDLKKLSTAAIEAFHKIKQPSYFTCLIVFSLDEAFSYLYGLRPRSFGKCERYQNSDVDDYIS